VHTQLLDRWLREVPFESVYPVAFVSALIFVNHSRRLNTIIVPDQPYTEQQVDASIALLPPCMRIILTRDATDPLPLTYERIYALCRDAVVIHGKGEILGDILRKMLDQSVARLERGLADDISEGVGFAVPFADALTWFEKQLELLQDVMTYLDRGYLVQTKEGDGIQFVPLPLQKNPRFRFADVLVDNRRIVCYYRGSFMTRGSTNGWAK
jgi:hypothetical protein